MIWVSETWMVASSFVEGDDCISIISTAAVTGKVRIYKTGHPWKWMVDHSLWQESSKLVTLACLLAHLWSTAIQIRRWSEA
jgi:hypothetical protein